MLRCCILLFVFLLNCGSFSVNATPHVMIRGFLYPESFGAKGDGVHDDTQAIQMVIDSLVEVGGGIVRLGSGTYLVKSLRLGPKVSIVGNGNGSTIIKQAKGQKQNCLIVKSIDAALKISDLIVVGEDSNIGIYFEKSGGFGENHPYLYTNTSNWTKSQAYKWIKIDNVCVYHFETGLEIEPWGFNINICNSTFSHCGNGVIMKCTDSFMYNCYVTNNSYNGLQIVGGNNKINNIKSIFNGLKDAKNCAAIMVAGDRCQIENCETQDNFCKGFHVTGSANLFSNCLSNSDGYCKQPVTYVPSVEGCGFRISAPNNSFSNCAVTSYTEKFGAVYHSPVIVDDPLKYTYSQILDDIKILLGKDRLLFHVPFKNIQTLVSKNKVENLYLDRNSDGCYFSSLRQKCNVVRNVEVNLSGLQMLVDFRLKGNSGKIIDLTGDKSMAIKVSHSHVSLFYQNEEIVNLELDKDVVFGDEDMRLIVSFTQSQNNSHVSLMAFEKTLDRGWIKKMSIKNINVSKRVIRNASINIGDLGILVKRLVMSYSPLPESVFMPYSNINRIYDSAFVFVDADSCM